MPQDSDRPLALTVSVTVHGTTCIVTPRGEIDVDSAAVVGRSLRAAMADRRFEHVVLNLSETDFIGSAGIAVVIGATRRAEERAIGFVVVPGPDEVQRVFDLCGFAELVPFVRDGVSQSIGAAVSAGASDGLRYRDGRPQTTG